MVSIFGEDQPVLTLKGLRPASIEKLGTDEKQKALRYVKMTIEGAERWKVDYCGTSFQSVTKLRAFHYRIEISSKCAIS